MKNWTLYTLLALALLLAPTLASAHMSLTDLLHAGTTFMGNDGSDSDGSGGGGVVDDDDDDNQDDECCWDDESSGGEG